MTSLLYMTLSFFEPSNSRSRDVEGDTMLQIEMSIIIAYLFDLCLQTIHILHNIDSNYCRRIFRHHAYLVKLIMVLILFSDFLYFRINHPNNTVRFGRYFRPCNNSRFAAY